MQISNTARSRHLSLSLRTHVTMFQPYQDQHQLLSSTTLPDLVLLRQHFPRPRLPHVPEAVHHELTRGEHLKNIKAGARIAIAVGSRGIADIAQIVRSV